MMTHTKLATCATLLIALLITSPFAALAGLYKWTDEKGNVHYGQAKPTQYKAIELDKPPPPPANTPELNKSAAEQIRDARKKSETTKKANKNKQAPTNAIQCQTAKKNLQVLKSGGRIQHQNQAGEEVTLSDEEIAGKIAETNKQIGFFCDS